MCDEGLFRKAGSVSRQRVLRVSPLWAVQEGRVCQQTEGAQGESTVCDVGLFRKAGSVSRQRVLRVSPVCVMWGCSGRQGLSADRGCSG